MVSKVTVVVVIVLLASGGLLYAGSRFLPNGNGHIPTTSTTSTSTNPTSGSHTTSSGSQSPLPNATLYKDIVRNIQDDSRIGGDKTVFTNLAVQLFTDLHYGTGQVKVLDPKTGNYVSEYLKEPTIQAMTNYSAALQEGLPRHSNSDLFLLGNGSQINSKIVDFSPRVVPNADPANPTHAIVVNNIPRVVWTEVEHLKDTPYVIQHPEMYEGFNSKIRQENLVLFDQLGQNPTNETVWKKIILSNWNYHWTATPEEGNTSKRITIFPWFNETAMSQQFPAKTDRQLIESQIWMSSALSQYDAKTGNFTGNGNVKSVIDDIALIVNGSQFGNTKFNSLYDRIMTAWDNKTLNVYNIYNRTDNELAWDFWNGRNGGNGVGPYTPLQDLAPQFSTFGLKYKPIINETEPIRKLAFAYGISTVDLSGPEQLDVPHAIIYAKALGGAVFEDFIPRTAQGLECAVHQTVAIPIPQYLSSKFPPNTIYGPGHSVSIVSNDFANIQSGAPYTERILPDNWGVIIKRYSSNC